MFCRNCGARNEADAKFCTGCGVRTEASAPKGSRFAAIILTILLMAGGGYGVYYYVTNEGPNESAESKGNIEEPVEEPVEENAGVILAETKPLPTDKKDIIKAAQKKVYTIVTDIGIGSGFLFTNNGMVVTNAHVVAGFTDVIVRDSEGVEEYGRVIGISDIEDIAVIEVEAYKGQNPLPAEMEITDVGTEVIALGSPNGFENSASIGYLTGVNRDISFDFEYEGIYQVDAQIAPGSSGGPLLDAETGKVIGINSLLYNGGNPIGFSIPLYSIHDSLMGWIKNPMSSTAVASVFGVYETYDYFDWLEDYEYEDETVYYYDTESDYEEEDYYEDYDYEDDTYEEFDYEDEAYEEDYYEDWSSEEDLNTEFDEYSLWAFIESYRDNYEIALAYEDFFYVEDMLLYDSEIYYGIADYINEISGMGMIFEFTELNAEGMEFYDGYALVHTYEAFDFMNAAGEWTVEERYKTYTVMVDEYGWYVISDIENQ